MRWRPTPPSAAQMGGTWRGRSAIARVVAPPVEGRGDPAAVRKQSRIHYGRPRAHVEARLRKALGEQ